ncbi:MAG: hypothetical protein HWN67_15075 [Candidatus Helarchaeota archaeon]|nr:hypothetical protein [Candidatus Helarchaeota archaeon]
MDVGIYFFPQYIKKEEINQILDHLSNYSISQIHVSFNYNYLLEDTTAQDLLFFKPDGSYYQKDIKLLQYSPDNWIVFQKFIESANRAGFKIIAWLNCLENQKAILEYPDWAQVNHIGEKSRRFLCPNNLSVQNYISNLVTNIIEKYPIQGIELFNARYPYPYKEELCCFCESCQREATNPRALEDLKEREIIDESWKGFSIKQLRKYFIKNSHLLSAKTLNEDNVFQSWNRFRYNSITRFVGKILISTRQTDQNVFLGTDVWPIAIAELVGQNYADLVTYQDLIYQILFMKDKQFQKHTEIIKEINELRDLIKKARGLKKFYTCINLDEKIQENELQRVINTTKQIGVKGIVFFQYKKEFEINLELLSEILKNP